MIIFLTYWSYRQRSGSVVYHYGYCEHQGCTVGRQNLGGAGEKKLKKGEVKKLLG